MMGDLEAECVQTFAARQNRPTSAHENGSTLAADRGAVRSVERGVMGEGVPSARSTSIVAAPPVVTGGDQVRRERPRARSEDGSDRKLPPAVQGLP